MGCRSYGSFRDRGSRRMARVKSVLDKGRRCRSSSHRRRNRGREDRVRYRDIDVGAVTQSCSRRTRRRSSSRELAKETRAPVETRALVVRPRIRVACRAGTLLSGAYVDSMRQSVTPRRESSASSAPILTAPGRPRVHVEAEDLGSIGYGTPIYFGAAVGSVTAFELDKDAEASRSHLRQRAYTASSRPARVLHARG